MLLLAWLACQSILAQNNTTNTQENSSPITTGISLPQLITTNINRSNLQYGLNFSNRLEHSNLSLNFKKIKSDDSKQLTITGGFHLNQSFSFSRNDNTDFYSINHTSFHLGANLKLFNKNNYFIEFGTQNRISKPGGIFEFDFINTNNAITLAIGKGRVDFVNDGAAALAITEKLSKYSILNRELTENEYALLVQKINDLKNRRKYVNRSYPLTEIEEIQDLLMSFGVISNERDVTAIIDDAYRYEPMIDRTTGSQFRIAVEGSYSYSNSFIDQNIKGLNTSMSYMLHSAINSKWQYNKGVSGYMVVSETRFSDPNFRNYKIRNTGLALHNDFHYLLDNKIRLSFLTNVGYNLINRVDTFDPIGNPYFENDGYFIKARTEVEFQISRTMSAIFGTYLDKTPEFTFTGLSFGLKF